jgi:hypothetical protein
MDEAGAPMVYNRQQREAAPQPAKASNGDSNDRGASSWSQWSSVCVCVLFLFFVFKV